MTKGIEACLETLNSVDLIIDATASNSVTYRIEDLINFQEMPAIASVSVGHECSRALITYRPPLIRGSTYEVLRNMKIKLASIPSLTPFYNCFWPSSSNPRISLFHPEPGCSEPTFIGSFTDVSLLSSISINEICKFMNEDCTDKSLGVCIDKNSSGLQIYRYKFSDYLELKNPIQKFRVKVSPFAHQQILSFIKNANRKRGKRKRLEEYY